MNTLNIILGEHQATIESYFESIEALRSSLNKPIEVEAFGPQIFLSIIGTKQDVSLTLIDKNNTIIETETYQLGTK